MNSRKLNNEMTWTLFVIFMMIFFVFMMAVPALSGEDNTDDSSSYFANPAQEQHAKNLSEKWAEIHSEEIAAALEALEEAEKSGDLEAIEAARAHLEELEVSVEEIAAMRSDGLGWGQIAHKLDIHPGTLGLGHYKSKMKRHKYNSSLRETTIRNHRTNKASFGEVNHGNKGIGKSGKNSNGGSGKGNAGKGKGKGKKG